MSEIVVKNLVKEYTVKSNFIRQISGQANSVKAVSGVSFAIKHGEIVGLVGESGCGKTTLGKMLARIEESSAGEIYLDGQPFSTLKRKKAPLFRRHVQMVFQDPYDSLDPKMTLMEIIMEPLVCLKVGATREARREKAIAMMEQVELQPAQEYINRYPHQLSGGQRQRVAIARALVAGPAFIIADEPVSMLDVSIRAGILNLLQKLNQLQDVGILFITHDLAIARFLCGRIIVMYLGKFVETVPTQALMQAPRHPYTQLLLSAAPDLFARDNGIKLQVGEAASAIAPPQGCRFSPRCPRAEDICSQEEPRLADMGDGHFCACHFPL